MNCPKHVESYSKKKIDKLLHLFGFIIRMKFQVCQMSVVISTYLSLLKRDSWREMLHTRMNCKQAGGEYFTVIIALCELLFGRNT